MSTIDRAVAGRYDAAVEAVEHVRERRRAAGQPHPSPDVLVDDLVKRYGRQLGAVAALSGGAAAAPGTGAATAALAAGADMAFTVGKLAEMILAIGVAHGHDAASLEERRLWVISVLSAGGGAITGLDGLAGRVGAEGGARLAGSIGARSARRAATTTAARAVSRVGGSGAARGARFLPFGIGAGVGAIGNLFVVRSVGRAARTYFAAQTPAGRPVVDDDVIDAEVLGEE